MIDHDAYERAERQRERQLQQETDARYLQRLDEIIQQHGLAYVRARPAWLVRLFPSGFLANHLPIERTGWAA